MDYYISFRVEGEFEKIVSKTREELKLEGFGVLTEIDVRDTLKKKLDVDFPNYIILGACNPSFAHRALSALPQVGVLLPCNVVVREEAGGVVEVLAMDPVGALSLVEREEVTAIAEGVREKIVAALTRL